MMNRNNKRQDREEWFDHRLAEPLADELQSLGRQLADEAVALSTTYPAPDYSAATQLADNRTGTTSKTPLPTAACRSTRTRYVWWVGSATAAVLIATGLLLLPDHAINFVRRPVLSESNVAQSSDLASDMRHESERFASTDGSLQDTPAVSLSAVTDETVAVLHLSSPELEALLDLADDSSSPSTRIGF